MAKKTGPEQVDPGYLKYVENCQKLWGTAPASYTVWVEQTQKISSTYYHSMPPLRTISSKRTV